MNELDYLDLLFDPHPITGKPYCAMCDHFIGDVRHGLGGITGHCEFSKTPKLKASAAACKRHYLPHGQRALHISWDFVDLCGGFDIKEWKEKGEVIMHPDKAKEMRRQIISENSKRTREKNAKKNTRRCQL